MLAQAFHNNVSTQQFTHSEQSSPSSRPLPPRDPPASFAKQRLGIKLIFIHRIIEIKAPLPIWEKPDIDDLLKKTVGGIYLQLQQYFEILPGKFQNLCVIKGEDASIFKCSDIKHHNGRTFYLFLQNHALFDKQWSREWIDQISQLSVSDIRMSKIKTSSMLQFWQINEYEKRGIKAPPLMCPLVNCGKSFKRSCDLMSHFNVETNAKPFSCQICGKRFRRKFMRKLHIARHMNQNGANMHYDNKTDEKAGFQERAPAINSSQLQTIEEALIQLDKCQSKLRFAADHAKKILGPLIQILKSELSQFSDSLLLYSINQRGLDQSQKIKYTLYTLKELQSTQGQLTLQQ